MICHIGISSCFAIRIKSLEASLPHLLRCVLAKDETELLSDLSILTISELIKINLMMIQEPCPTSSPGEKQVLK